MEDSDNTYLSKRDGGSSVEEDESLLTPCTTGTPSPLTVGTNHATGEILAKDQENLGRKQSLPCKTTYTLLFRSNEGIKNLPSKRSSGSFHLEHSTSETNDGSANNGGLDSSITGKTTAEGGVSTKHGKTATNVRPIPASTNNAFKAQSFIKDYYRSLDTVRRYIIAFSILSFLIGFHLLYWYSTQTHFCDMEIVKLNEKQVITAQQKEVEALQEKFKDLLEQNMELRNGGEQLKTILESKQKEVDGLQGELKDLLEQNMELRKRGEQLDTNLESKQKEVDSLQGELKNLQEEDAKLRSNCDTKLLGHYEREIESLKKINTLLEERNIELKKKVENSEPSEPSWFNKFLTTLVYPTMAEVAKDSIIGWSQKRFKKRRKA